MNRTVHEYLKIIILDIVCIAVFLLLYLVIGRAMIKRAFLSAVWKIFTVLLMFLWLKLQKAAGLKPSKVISVYMAAGWLLYLMSYHSWHWFVYLALTGVPAFFILSSEKRLNRDAAYFLASFSLFAMGTFCILVIPFGERFGGESGTENYRLLGLLAAGFGILRACSLWSLGAMKKLFRMRLQEIKTAR